MREPSVKGAPYKLVVRGELDGRFAYLFDGMEMERVEGTNGVHRPRCRSGAAAWLPRAD